MSTTSIAPTPRSLPKLWLALALWCSLAYAEDSSKPADEAKTLIASVKADPENRKLAHDPLEKAENALERAQNARQSQDPRHADLLARLGLEWAETARDLTRAAELEKRASEAQEKAAKVEAKSVRALAIVEAAVARRGRAQEKLEALQQAAAPNASSEGAKTNAKNQEQSK